MAKKNILHSEAAPPAYQSATGDDAIIAQALAILDARVAPGQAITSPAAVMQYLTLKFSPAKREQFGILLLNSRHRMTGFEVLFSGTINTCAVYPREVVRVALARNSAAVILCHNHPSGDLTPGESDKALMQQLKDALTLVDVRVLDHIVVAGGRTRCDGPYHRHRTSFFPRRTSVTRRVPGSPKIPWARGRGETRGHPRIMPASCTLKVYQTLQK